MLLYHGVHPARRNATSITLPVFGVIFLGDRRACSCCPMVQSWLLPLFWFCAKDRLHSVRVYLGPRHAAALPLRPTDGLRLEVPVPGRGAQSAGHRLPGGSGRRSKWTSSSSSIFALIAVVCAINVVVQTHPISSALSLVGVMGSLAVLYLLLGARIHRRRADDRLCRRHHGAVHLRHHAAERRRRSTKGQSLAGPIARAFRCCWCSWD